MIGVNTLKVGTFNKHLIAREYKKKAYKRVIVAGLMLTSMVDMFSLLVIFLLQSFSNSPEVMALSKGVTLPPAVSSAASIDAPVIAISADQIILDQKEVGVTEALLSSPQALIDQLNQMKNAWHKAHPNEEFKGDIHLQADKGLSSTLVSQVMSVLISQGYYSVHLAVVAGQKQ